MIRKINNYLFVAFGFSFPISIAVANILLTCIALLWIIEGDFRKKFIEIKNNKFVIAVLLFFIFYLLGLFWSNSPIRGWHHVSIYYILPLSFILFTTLDGKYANKAIISFIIGMTISEIASYAMYLGLWEGLFPGEPFASPFYHHVVYTPMVAFTVFLLINKFVYSNESKKVKALVIFFIITMSFNVFISGGRTGQIVFIFLTYIFAFLYFKKSAKIFIAILLAVPLIVVSIYFTNNTFKARTDMTIQTLQTGSRTSPLGERINFIGNTLRMIQSTPIFGTGTGDFKEEYYYVNQKYTPNVRHVDQPHNQYLFVWAQLGIVGLSFLIYIFYAMYKISKGLIKDKLTNIRYIFIIFFMVILISDIYLYAFATQALFVYFGVILFRKYDPNPFKLESKNHD